MRRQRKHDLNKRHFLNRSSSISKLEKKYWATEVATHQRQKKVMTIVIIQPAVMAVLILAKTIGTNKDDNNNTALSRRWVGIRFQGIRLHLLHQSTKTLS